MYSFDLLDSNGSKSCWRQRSIYLSTDRTNQSTNNLTDHIPSKGAKMKIVKCISFLFATTSANAFQPVVVMPSPRARMMQLAAHASSADDDAEKLEAMSKAWEELRKKEKEVEGSHDEVSGFVCLCKCVTYWFHCRSSVRCSICIDKNSQFSLLLLSHHGFSFFSPHSFHPKLLNRELPWICYRMFSKRRSSTHVSASTWRRTI